ncbi:MAG TPA: hypothetical protein VHG35_04375 [Gemmatimonadales bacterium]|nr:hypothetical protein [Gemmatimonadales bacterium]
MRRKHERGGNGGGGRDDNLPPWFRRWFGNGHRNGNGSPPPRSGSASGDPEPERFRLELEDLIGQRKLDWYRVGRDAGEAGSNIHAIRRLVRGYFDYRTALATSSQERVKSKLDTPTDGSDKELLGREKALEDEIDALTKRKESLQNQKWEDPGASVRDALRANQEKHVEFLDTLNAEVTEDFRARMRLVHQSVEDLQAVHQTFAEKMADVQQSLSTAENPDVRQALTARLSQLESAFEQAITVRVRVSKRIREEVAKMDGLAVQHAEIVTADHARKVSKDAVFIRDSLAHLNEPVLAKRPGGLVLLLVAVVGAAVAEFAVVSKITGNILDIGVFSQLLARVYSQGRWHLDRLSDLVSTIFISFIPFALGFWVKSLLDSGLPRRGEARWIVNLGLAVSAVGYLVSLGWRLARYQDVSMGFVFVFLTLTLTLLNGWLLHLLLRSVDLYRRKTRDIKERMEALDAEIADRRKRVDRLRAERNDQRERRDAAHKRLEDEADAIKSLLSGGGGPLEAALAAVESGYAHGLVVRAGGVPQPGSPPESEDELSALWRRLRLLRGLFPDPEHASAATASNGSNGRGQP